MTALCLYAHLGMNLNSCLCVNHCRGLVTVVVVLHHVTVYAAVWTLSDDDRQNAYAVKPEVAILMTQYDGFNSGCLVVDHA